jgi:hypothetical protein
LDLRLLKKSAAVIVEPFVYLYNLSFYTGCLPDKLKIIKIVSVFRKGDPSGPDNNMPILHLSIFQKLLEKLIYDRLYGCLKLNNVIYLNISLASDLFVCLDLTPVSEQY